MSIKFFSLLSILVFSINVFSQHIEPSKDNPFAIKKDFVPYNKNPLSFKAKQIFITASLPLGAYPMHLYQLTHPRTFRGTIPFTLATINTSTHAFITNRLAIGLNYRYANFRINNTTLINKNDGSSVTTNLVGKVNNLMVQARYYYSIRPWLKKSSFSPRVLFYVGSGLGYGNINWQADVNGNFDYYSIPLVQNLIYQIDAFGVNYALSKRLQFNMSVGYGANGFANMSIEYRVYNPKLKK